MRNRSVIYAAAAAALGFAAPAHGQQAAVETVRYQDLNLARGADVRALRQRLENAVQRVCPAGLDHPAALSDEVVACRAEARRDARAAMIERTAYLRRSPELVAAH